MEGTSPFRKRCIRLLSLLDLSFLQLQFFGHLTVIKVITPDSMLGLLRSFLAVLDEPGVSYTRALSSAICAGEGLLWVRALAFFE